MVPSEVFGIRVVRKLLLMLGLKRRHVPVIPPSRTSKPAEVDYSPHLVFGSAQHIVAEYLREYVREHPRGKFLDVGGRQGEYRHLAGPLDYHLLDIAPAITGPNVIQGDICECPQIPSGSFDCVFSNNVFEHVAEPWQAAREIGRILKPRGLAICITVFAWRYHPVPQDYWRYTHSALKLLFERYGGLTTLTAAYDLSARRNNKVGGKIEGGLDLAPVDDMGGWRENWTVFYVGQRPNE